MSLSRSLSRAKRRFQHAYQDWRLRRAVAQEKRTTFQAEARRAKSGLRGESSLKLRYQRLKLWWHQRAERRAKAWARRKERYPWIRWLENKQGWIVGTFFLALVAAFCVFLFRETHLQPAKTRGGIPYGNDPAVKVNGNTITMATYLQSLEMTYGPLVLQRLTEQEVIRQEAARLRIALTPEERLALKEALKDHPQAGIRYPALESEILTRKLVLREISKSRKHEIYEDFKADLALYRLRGIRFDTKSKAEAFAGELKKGTPIVEAAAKHSNDGAVLKAFDSLTLGDIREQLGAATSEALQGRQPGEMTRPVSAPGGYAIYVVDEIQTSYEEIEGAIDTVLVESERSKFLFRLLSKAKIESQYLDQNLLATPTPVSTKAGPNFDREI